MSANAEVLRGSDVIGSAAREAVLPAVAAVGAASRWNPEGFAREQMRSLVRRVFFANGAQAIKQVVFTAADPELDITNVCEEVVRGLSRETRADVALMEGGTAAAERIYGRDLHTTASSIKSLSTQVASNLWRVQRFGSIESGEDSGAMHWIPCLAKLRTEFEYVVIQGQAAGSSSEAALVGQLTDGIVLVLGAHKTRQATALKVKETLEAADCRILGTVLTERRFPIPGRIYKRL